MKLSLTTRSIAVASALVCASALAQTRFCLGGDLDHLTSSQKASCNAKMQRVKSLAAAFHAPEDWHFVVVCGEEGWKDYTAYSSNQTASLAAATGDTNLQQHETFLRDERLDLSDARGFQRVVAHEVAGILLHSTDEVAINNQVDRWIDSRGAATSGL